MKRAAIIELSESHGECIYSQILFLKDSVDELHLILNSALTDQIQNDFEKVKRHFFSSYSTMLERIKTYLYIRQIIKKKNIDTIIFNTATGTQVWELIKFIPKKVALYGSMHDANKFIRSNTQKRINKRIKNYFVLNDYIQEYVLRNNISDISTRAYYPIFFPENKNTALEKSVNEFWITIPGKVEQKRRDYLSIIEAIKNRELSSNIKFILLGHCKKENSDSALILEKLREYNLVNNFVIFESFVDSNTYLSYLKRSDMIMPAVEPEVEFYNTYKNSQITGAYNLAFGFGIPLFYNADLNNIKDLQNFGINYTHSNLYDKLIKLIDNKTLLEETRQKIQNENKFTLEFQKENFISFII